MGKRLRFGEILAGKYEIESLLGTGAMGVVVAARHRVLGERVAIKFLLPDAVGNPLGIARFTREAQAAARIKSEHVARVFDVGSCEDGTPFMVMEYLDGMDLGLWLKNQGPLPVFQAVEFVLQACEAIAEAHVLGIVHRDLKPSNLFCSRLPDGSLAIKVLDFGISKVTPPQAADPDAALRITDTTVLMGSPMYMSPEQLHCTCNVDLRTDIWSLGIILFELLTGKSPFVGASLTEFVLNVANRPPQSVRRLRPDVPRELGAVIEKCLRKDPCNRYATVAEFALALAPFGSKRAEASIERVLGVIESAKFTGSDVWVNAGHDRAVSTAQGPMTSKMGMRTHRVRYALAFSGLLSSLGLALLTWTALHGAIGARRAEVSHRAVVIEPATAGTTRTRVPAARPLAIVPAPPSAARAPQARSSITNSNSAEGARLRRAIASTPHERITAASRDANGAVARATRSVKTNVSSNTSKSTESSNHALRAGCNPPFSLDALGRKHFKRECYLNQTP